MGSLTLIPGLLFMVGWSVLAFMLLQSSYSPGMKGRASASLPPAMSKFEKPRKTETVKKWDAKASRLFGDLHDDTKIGLVNMHEIELESWGIKSNSTQVQFRTISSNITWEKLFPGWIDEESKKELKCPEIPMPEFSFYGEFDVIITKLPCQRPKEGWNRDVLRLQVHLVSANLAVKKGRRNERGKVRMIFQSNCEPMRDIFRCDDLVRNAGSWWIYEADVSRLEEKMNLPPGTCKLIVPLKKQGDNVEMDVAKFPASPQTNISRREAYATVLHSSDSYVCGAIVLAHSIRKTDSTRDLVLLHDDSIGHEKLRALTSSGWSLRKIERIRNPHPRPDKLFQYNYSKLRVFQLIDYDKIILIDTDMIVLRNLDLLFQFPSITARRDHYAIFNSGIMVLEPSNCTFQTMMMHIESLKSYNGGDQGFLNEFFVWWHRLTRRTTFLKLVGPNATKNTDWMLDLNPPQFYAIHYFGLKPWMCYRDYDCNWDLESVRTYVSDVAHRKWWNLHDEMEEELKKMCKLSMEQKNRLQVWRSEAEKKGYSDGHWRINITDPRKDW
ncbi:hypothetical protein LUZ60_008297 [Juncus effusus]|nr:hypothetical protein LUZ60_008297 [Juncus effusus]